MLVLGSSAVRLPYPHPASDTVPLVLAITEDDEVVRPSRVIHNPPVITVQFDTPFTGNVWIC